MTGRAQGRRRIRGGSGVRVAQATVRRELRRRDGGVLVPLDVSQTRQEGHGVGRTGCGPAVDGRRVDMGVTGQGATAIALGPGVGLGPGHRAVKSDGATGHLVCRGARGHAIHGRGVQVLKVGQGPSGAISHVVAGGAGDGIGRIQSVVRALAVPTKSVIELGSYPRCGRNAVTDGALGGRIDRTGPPVGGRLTTVATGGRAGQGRGVEGGHPALGVVGGVQADWSRARRGSGSVVGAVVVGEGACPRIGVAGIAGQGRGQAHVLRVGSPNVGKSCARGPGR